MLCAASARSPRSVAATAVAVISVLRLVMHSGSLRGVSAAMGATPHLRLDEPPPDRVARELDTVAHAELAEDVGAVALHRLEADDEHRRDLLRRVPLGDQLQHLELARGQRLVLLVALVRPLEE